jgi:hypothetical protein
MLATRLAADFEALLAPRTPPSRLELLPELRLCLEDCLQHDRLGWVDLRRVYQMFMELPFQDALDEVVRWWDPWFPDDEDDNDPPSGQPRKRGRRKKKPTLATCSVSGAFVAR